MDRPLVSVVIPAYNAELYIDEAIRSVQGQTYDNIEIIIVDDGSTDKTAKCVSPHVPAVQYIYQNNSGGYPGRARNTGISHASGMYICFLDADDVMQTNRVEKQVNFYSKHPGAGLLFMDYQNYSVNGNVGPTHFQTCNRLQEQLEGRQSLELQSAEATAILAKENFGLPSTTMIRRDVLTKIPGFSTELMTSEDFHFFYRIARFYNVGVINEVGSFRRLHDNNVTGNSIKVLSNYIISRTDLRNSESNELNKRLLNECLYRGELDLTRTYANQRKIIQAFFHNYRAMICIPAATLEHLKSVMYAFVRTLAIALHLKKPSP